MKELYFFETTESTLFDAIVTLQCILFVLLNTFTSSDLVAWLRSKVSLIPLFPARRLSVVAGFTTDIFVCGRILATPL